MELPEDISDKDRQASRIPSSAARSRRWWQTGPEFVIEEVENLDADAQALLTLNPDPDASTYIVGARSAAGADHCHMSAVLAGLGIKIEIASWRNLVLKRVVAAYPRCAFSDVFYQWQGCEQGVRWRRPWVNTSSG